MHNMPFWAALKRGIPALAALALSLSTDASALDFPLNGAFFPGKEITGIEVPAPALPNPNPAAFDKLRELIDSRYSYRDIRDINWDGLFSAYAPSLSQEGPPDVFGKLTAEMLSKARDLHIGVRTATGRITVYKKPVTININRKGLEELLVSRKLSKAVTAGTVKAEPEIGYLAIDSWGSGTDTADVPVAIDAINGLLDKPALIIDLRYNSGGSDGNAKAVFSHLTGGTAAYEKAIVRDPQYPGGWSETRTFYIEPSQDGPHYKGRIIVLSGRVCMSSCEGSILMLRHIGGFLIGDTTRGSTGSPKEYDLGNGVIVKFPSWKAYTLDGVMIEGNGIAPDMRVEFLPGQDYGAREPVLEAAIDYITKNVLPARQQGIGR